MKIVYLTADEEDNYYFAQANAELDEEGRFVDEQVYGTVSRGNFDIVPVNESTLWMSRLSRLSQSLQLVFPFFENDDSNRALMGSNMQRQAVPLLVTRGHPLWVPVWNIKQPGTLV